MTEAPDVSPDFPSDDEDAAVSDEGVEGRGGERDGDRDGGDVARTGDPRVDEVLASLDALHDLPVGEHAAVFEAAHEQLRSALEPDRETA
jgi:hypothetical protein